MSLAKISLFLLLFCHSLHSPCSVFLTMDRSPSTPPISASIRRIPQNNWKRLQEELNKQLSRTAQLELGLFMKNYIENDQPEFKQVPGNCLVNEIYDRVQTGKYYWADAVKLFLHTLLHYDSVEQMEENIVVPHSHIERLFHWSRHKITILSLHEI